MAEINKYRANVDTVVVNILDGKPVSTGKTIKKDENLHGAIVTMPLLNKDSSKSSVSLIQLRDGSGYVESKDTVMIIEDKMKSNIALNYIVPAIGLYAGVEVAKKYGFDETYKIVLCALAGITLGLIPKMISR